MVLTTTAATSGQPPSNLVPFLMAILHGAHVVTPAWVYQCVSHAGWVPEADQEGPTVCLVGLPASEFAVPRAAASVRAHDGPPLLGGRRFYVHGDFGLGNAAVARLVLAPAP